MRNLKSVDINIFTVNINALLLCMVEMMGVEPMSKIHSYTASTSVGNNILFEIRLPCYHNYLISTTELLQYLFRLAPSKVACS